MCKDLTLSRLSTRRTSIWMTSRHGATSTDAPLEPCIPRRMLALDIRLALPSLAVTNTLIMMSGRFLELRDAFCSLRLLDNARPRWPP